jgi:hypothetical protein
LCNVLTALDPPFENGRGSGQYDFTSLLGADKKKPLAAHPDKFANCLMPGTCEVVVKIWKDFNEIYKMITVKHTTDEICNDCFEKSNGSNFLPQ